MLIAIGRIRRAVGQSGEIEVEPFTPNPERFFELESLFLELKQRIEPVVIEKVRIRDGKLLLRLSGITDRTGAHELKGAILKIHESKKIGLSEGQFFIDDLPGLKVLLSGTQIGVVRALIEGRNQLLEISSDEKDFLIPFQKEFVTGIDQEQRILYLDEKARPLIEMEE